MVPNTVIGGTSAVAPLWAALIARINQTSGAAAGYLEPADL
jgi:kumamolisin